MNMLKIHFAKPIYGLYLKQELDFKTMTDSQRRTNVDVCKGREGTELWTGKSFMQVSFEQIFTDMCKVLLWTPEIKREHNRQAYPAYTLNLNKNQEWPTSYILCSWG